MVSTKVKSAVSSRSCDESVAKRAVVKRVLVDLATAYSLVEDGWRARAYAQAASLVDAVSSKTGEFLVNLDRPQETYGIGASIASIIRRICEEKTTTSDRVLLSEVLETTGHVDDHLLRKLRAYRLFRGILGVGDKKALQLARDGYASLQELCRDAHLLGLDKRVHQFGMRHYRALNSRIPRSQATYIIRHVTSVLVRTMMSPDDDDVDVLPLGSYRRGKSTVGDVDLLVVLPPSAAASSANRLLEAAEHELLRDGAYALTVSRGAKRASFVYKSRKSHHQDVTMVRVDIFVAHRRRDDPGSVAAFILHATGSAVFNETMRQAAKTQGLKLNEYGLFDVASGARVKGIRTEADIFRALGLPYVNPHDRG